MPRKSTPERDALIAELLEKMRRQLQEQLPDETATLYRASLLNCSTRVAQNRW